MRSPIIMALALVSSGAIAADIAISMKDHSFAPDQVTARVGDTLVFTNDDNSDHVVFVANRGFAFDLGVQKPKEVRRYTVKQAGRFEVECVPHAAMKLVVEVTP